jgi:ATP adenylyltransferase
MSISKLWAPWRIGYIKKIKKEKGCLFCRVYPSRDDKRNFVFLRSRHAFGMLNLYPYNNGHIMIAPVKHVKTLSDLTDPELCDIMACVKKATSALEIILKPDGFNIGINVGRVAGAGIEKHLHIHVVPRWNGDTNFMPTLFNTKVISQSLGSLYDKLVKEIRKKSYGRN